MDIKVHQIWLVDGSKDCISQLVSLTSCRIFFYLHVENFFDDVIWRRRIFFDKLLSCLIKGLKTRPQTLNDLLHLSIGQEKVCTEGINLLITTNFRESRESISWSNYSTFDLYLACIWLVLQFAKYFWSWCENTIVKVVAHIMIDFIL